MIKFFKSCKKRTVWALFISVFDCLFFYSMRPLWSGLGKTIGSQAWPYVFMALMLLGLVAVFVLMLLKKEGWYMWVLFGLSIFWSAAFLVIFILGGSDYLLFVLRNFLYAFLAFMGVYLIAYLIFFYPQSPWASKKWLKVTVFSLALLSVLFSVVGVRVNYFTYSPVVYAVEDSYQIVFSTRNKSNVSVLVGGVSYYDTYAGSDDSETTIHKVVVPMASLDENRSYTIEARSVFYRGPFGGWTGRTISEKHDFYPVDSSDGLNYFSVSDVHGAVGAAASAASYFGDKLDFFVMDGDIVSLVNNEIDANLANKLAYKVTKGERPVVYARGNHETKEEYANKLYRHVGARADGSFYYYFRLKDVFGLVLDIGEDHDEDWWEYYGTAHFTDYQNAQLKMIEGLDPSLYASSKYRMVVCHIPLMHINYRKNFYDFKIEATSLLNGLNLDMNIMGHQHQFLPFAPGTLAPLTKLVTKPSFKGDSLSGMVTDFNFPSMMVGKRSDSQKSDAQTFLTGQYGGMATSVDFVSKKETCTYINHKKEIIMVDNPYVEGEAQSSFVYSLKNC